MAKPNYSFAKRQRDLAKKERKEEKRKKKAAANAPDTPEGVEPAEGVETPDDAAPAPADVVKTPD